MAIREIAQMGNPILYREAETVMDPRDPEIARLAEDMKDTLIHVGGSGIAAPQVFESLRLVVYRLSPRLISGAAETADPWIVLVNPQLVPTGDEMVSGWERCLSIPGLHGKVPRHKSLRMTYQSLDGAENIVDAEGALATLLQHECDHLDGVLYPMRMLDLSKLEFNAEPGHLAQDIVDGEKVWPVLQDLVDAWPGRSRWFDN
ncbi:MAG: peptide deformylase [Alphaproteobacteria bacterium]|nr:peptide deformylase [Alphaproteobacteria bacterium]